MKQASKIQKTDALSFIANTKCSPLKFMRLWTNTTIRNISILIVRQTTSACTLFYFSPEKNKVKKRKITRSCAHSISFYHTFFSSSTMCLITCYFFAYFFNLTFYALFLMGFLFFAQEKNTHCKKRALINGHWMWLINKSLIASATRLGGFLFFPYTVIW